MPMANDSTISNASARLIQGVVCIHCSLPVPAALINKDQDEQFCCHGCETAYAIIHGCGLESYYKVKRAIDPEATSPARSTGKAYHEMDTPAYHAMHVSDAGEGLLSCEFRLQGVHCAACVWLLEKLPMICPGVVNARLELRRALLRVVWIDQKTSLSHIAQGIDSLGYPVHPARGSHQRQLQRLEFRKNLIRIGIAGACAGNVMLISFALYGGMFSGMAAAHEAYLRWVSLIIGSVALIGPGRVFFRGAMASLKMRVPHMDLPIAIGLSAAFVYGSVNTILGGGEVYFDSLTAVIFLLLVGRAIQSRQQHSAAEAIEALFTLTPGTARLIAGSQVQEVPIEAIAPGDTVQVLAGDSVPVDGIVVQGISEIDQSLLTGEAMPVLIEQGSAVAAGAVNLASPVEVRATATGADTRMGRLMKLVEESAQRRAPIVRLADRIAGVFVVVVLMIAAVAGGAWLMIEPSHAVSVAVTVLIVCCPCALGLATPLAMVVAMGRAARRGVLIKGADSLERMAQPGLILLDKTGTITEGCMKLVRFEGDQSTKLAVAAIEKACRHPIASALVRGLAENAIHLPEVTDMKQSVGGGVSARVDNAKILVGSEAFIEGAGAVIPQWIKDEQLRCLNEGLTPILVARDGCVVAIAQLGDPIRPDAAQAVQELTAAGWKAGILSGDHPQVVTAVARQIGVPDSLCWGGMTPEDKLTLIREKRIGSSVVMVGDGINDAGALAEADVGIAVHSGAEASMAASDVYLSNAGLMPILELTKGSLRTMRVIRLGLGVSLAYNAVAVVFAVTGVINPLVAAIAMPISSVSVLGIAFRMRTFSRKKPETCEKKTVFQNEGGSSCR